MVAIGAMTAIGCMIRTLGHINAQHGYRILFSNARYLRLAHRLQPLKPKLIGVWFPVNLIFVAMLGERNRRQGGHWSQGWPSTWVRRGNGSDAGRMRAWGS